MLSLKNWNQALENATDISLCPKAVEHVEIVLT